MLSGVRKIENSKMKLKFYNESITNMYSATKSTMPFSKCISNSNDSYSHSANFKFLMKSANFIFNKNRVRL